MANPAIFTHVI